MAEGSGIATKHEVLVNKAKHAIVQVTSDLSVSPRQTIESLEKLGEYIEETVRGLYEGQMIQEERGNQE